MLRRRLTVALQALAIGVLILVAFVIIVEPLARDEPPRGGLVVTRSFYAEPSGRQCSQTVARVPGSVSVAVSCSYPPAESRIADLLEGAGQ